MESHYCEEQPSQQQQLNVKRSTSLAEEVSDHETSTANSLLSIEKLHITSPPSSSKTSDICLAPAQLDQLDSKPSAEAPPAESNQVRCLYCDKLCDKESIAGHVESCEMTKIQCEGCGEMVMIDIFDFHLEVCTHGVEITDNLSQQGNENEFMLQMNNEAPAPVNEGSWNVEEENEANQEEGEEEEGESEEYEQGFDPNALTYEQLMTLDNFVVKKGMTDEEMEKFPIDVHVSGFDGPGSCSVCISDLENGEVVRKLPCAHKYHKECIDTWLEQNITCPVCKKYLR